MKPLQQRLLQFQGRLRSLPIVAILDGVAFDQLPARVRSIKGLELLASVRDWLTGMLEEIKSIGRMITMDDYEKRKLGIFNQLNFFQFIFGVTIPIAGLLSNKKMSSASWVVATLPAFISIAVLWLNHRGRRDAALITYFLCYPIVTSIVYMSGMNLGVELFFILYGILSVFFIADLSLMLYSVALSMISYFMLAVAWKNYQFQLETANLGFYLFNQVLAIAFIFYGLYLIKKENTGYQVRILNKNRDLHRKNLEIQQKKVELADKAEQLKIQTEELTDLNNVKNKLFSIISHDLKTPMYALRNLFMNMQQLDLPAEEIKTMVPDVLQDLNYTTGLMENLLQWAKSQMSADAVNPHPLDLHALGHDVIRLARTQAAVKKITLECNIEGQVMAMADEDMVHLVLRNLLSNAIKFTPEGGTVAIDTCLEDSGHVRVLVADSGVGISNEDLAKINQNIFFTSSGTASESGTGLGLMLCKEFVRKNGGAMRIDSELGKGSTFSFTLPIAMA